MPRLGHVKARDVLAGGLVVAIGVGAVLEASSYQIGELANMGPGYYPVALGAILIALGLAIPFVMDSDGEPENQAAGPDSSLLPRVRGIGGIIAGVIAFMLLGDAAGLAPAIFALVFISALGDTLNTIRSAALLALGMTVLGVILFGWALPIQLPIVRHW